jgi:hypothetical protein
MKAAPACCLLAGPPGAPVHPAADAPVVFSVAQP